jgi:hypothetical protein
MITLTRGTESLVLDPDLYWQDEHAWHPVVQSVERSITGALIVQVAGGVGLPGRPITLQPEDDTSAWMTQENLATLQAWAAVPQQTFQLLLRGVSRAVMFRHQDAPAIEARPVVHFSDVVADDAYRVTLKFMEI